MQNFKQIVAATALAALSFAANANLVTNGGFETGNLSGWTGGGAFVGGSFNQGPHTGNNAAYFGCVGGTCGGISQSFATTAGAVYDFSFFYNSDGGMPNEFQAFFDNVSVFHVFNDPRHGYVQESFTLTASSNLTTISFFGRNDPTWQALDDVSVTQRNAIPEPGSVALLGLGVLGLVAARRRIK